MDRSDPDFTWGLCCIRHPEAIHNDDREGMRPASVWPGTLADDFCGEHPDFPAYIASLKEPTLDTSITLLQALELHGESFLKQGARPDGKLTSRAYYALMSDTNPYLHDALVSIQEQDLVGMIRGFGRTSSLEFRKWREAVLSTASNPAPASPDDAGVARQ